MKKYENIIINMEFDEESIQSCAESTIGRELSGLELHRLKLCWPDFDSTGWLQNEVMSNFIKGAIKGEIKWADEKYLKNK